MYVIGVKVYFLYNSFGLHLLVFVIGIKLIYHRAKQDGSLFQGHWGKGEGREATSPWGTKPPLKVAKQPLLCCGVTLR